MFLNNKIIRTFCLGASLAIGLYSCQKLTRPALGDYPKDSNPPGGPLKFYTAFEGTSVDSIRAKFGSETNVTYTEGLNGKAMTAGLDGYITYPSNVNDLNQDSSFTIAFWEKKTGPNPAGKGTSFAFGIATSDQDNALGQLMFLEFEDAGNPSSADSAAAKFHMLGSWYEFTGTKRMPKVLDGQWHHLAFTFDAATMVMTPYIDGAAMTNLPPDFGKFTGGLGLSQISGIVVGGPGLYAIGKKPEDDPGTSWMGNFNGSIDQFRAYGAALSATEVAALFTAKQ